MAHYRILVPARRGSDMPDMTLSVEASNWLVALKESLRTIGEQGDSLQNILCETVEDGTMRVADPASKRVFVIREVEPDQGSHDSSDLLQKAEDQARRSREEAERAEATRLEAQRRLAEMKRQEEAAKEAADADARAEETRQAKSSLKQANLKAQEASARAAEDATGTVGNISVAEVRKAAGKAGKESTGKEAER